MSEFSEKIQEFADEFAKEREKTLQEATKRIEEEALASINVLVSERDAAFSSEDIHLNNRKLRADICKFLVDQAGLKYQRVRHEGPNGGPIQFEKVQKSIVLPERDGGDGECNE